MSRHHTGRTSGDRSPGHPHRTPCSGAPIARPAAFPSRLSETFLASVPSRLVSGAAGWAEPSRKVSPAGTGLDQLSRTEPRQPEQLWSLALQLPGGRAGETQGGAQFGGGGDEAGAWGSRSLLPPPPPPPLAALVWQPGGRCLRPEPLQLGRAPRRPRCRRDEDAAGCSRPPAPPGRHCGALPGFILPPAPCVPPGRSRWVAAGPSGAAARERQPAAGSSRWRGRLGLGLGSRGHPQLFSHGRESARGLRPGLLPGDADRDPAAGGKIGPGTAGLGGGGKRGKLLCERESVCLPLRPNTTFSRCSVLAPPPHPLKRRCRWPARGSPGDSNEFPRVRR